MSFQLFSRAVHARYEQLSQNELFVVEVDNIFNSYLAAFPQGSNPLFRERTQHDCNCCKQFIRKLGTLVTIGENGQTLSVWDGMEHLPHPYDSVAARLSDIVRQAPIRTVFRSKETRYGIEYNYDTKTNERWDHFHGLVSRKHFTSDPETKRGERDAIAQVLRRGLLEIRDADLDNVLELIDSNALYRGEEHRGAVTGFRDLMRKWKDPEWRGSSAFVWAHLDNRNARFRNTVIGILLVDLAEGKDLEDAVRIFEAKVAPQNYKRTTALITPRMVDEAVATLQELGLEGAVQRRFTRLDDMGVNNILFVDNSVRSKMKGGVAGLLADSVQQRHTITPSKAEKISITDFVGKVLPTATSLDVLVENKHTGNFVSLTGGDGPERLFKWNNNFAWSYDGEVADSVKQRVKAAGGNINTLMRVSLSWFNYDDLDIHCITPDGIRIYFHNKMGILDVDMNAAQRRDSRSPVENLAFMQLRDGIYTIIVNNYMKKESVDNGFAIEVEYGGVLHQFGYAKAVRTGENVQALVLTVKSGKLVNVSHGAGLTGGSISSEKWGVKTETLVPVTIALNSPNHWDGENTGQKHWFFMLKGCKNPDAVRGIYNEFLRSDLEKHRKVFEVLGAKTKCPPTDDQISGVGFSSARGDTVTVVVNGRRPYTINF